MNDLSIDVSYIGRLSTRLSQFKRVRQDVWCARCPICGDSKKNPFKKRFYIYKNNNHYSCKCHNCGYTSTFGKFLESEFPEEYKSYLLEKFPFKKTIDKSRFKKKSSEIVKKSTKKCNGLDYSCLIKFEDLSPDHPARLYVEKRKIPFDRVLYSPRFSDFILYLNMNKYIVSYEYAKEPRLIIPFYKESGISTVCQARAFSKKETLRYITIKEDENENKIFGMDRIDKTKPIWVVEGPIDAMMIPNCIAMSGISTKIPSDIEPIFIFDNEPRNRDVVKMMRKRLEQGHKVVIFSDKDEYNDLNDFIVKGGFSAEKLVDKLTKIIYSEAVGLLKLNDWRKV
jgi:hypothetical protein